MNKKPQIAPKKAYTVLSNKKNIRNALSQVSLAGPNATERDEVLKFLEECEHTNFVILFKGVLGGCGYKALYHHDIEGEVRKVHGPQSAPEMIEADMVERFFKYSSSGKEFINLGAKSFSAITDAVALKKEFT